VWVRNIKSEEHTPACAKYGSEWIKNRLIYWLDHIWNHLLAILFKSVKNDKHEYCYFAHLDEKFSKGAILYLKNMGLASRMP
jgi:hypothetical protein